MAHIETVTSGEFPQPLFLMLSNHQITNPKLPDLETLIKPRGFPDDIWQKSLTIRLSHIESYPHPPYLSTTYCIGNKKIGHPANHLAIVEATAWKWKSPEETGWGYGIWVTNDELCVPISGWMLPEKLPKEYRFGGNIVKVRNERNHGGCPECFSDF